jgi:hypothetical protein
MRALELHVRGRRLKTTQTEKVYSLRSRGNTWTEVKDTTVQKECGTIEFVHGAVP